MRRMLAIICLTGCAADPINPHLVGECDRIAWNAALPQYPAANFESCEAACEAPFYGSNNESRDCIAAKPDGSPSSLGIMGAQRAPDGLWGACFPRLQHIPVPPPDGTILVDVEFLECTQQPPPAGP